MNTPPPDPKHTNQESATDGSTANLPAGRIVAIVGGTVAVLLVGLIIGGVVGSNLGGDPEPKTVTVSVAANTSAGSDTEDSAGMPASTQPTKSSQGALKVGQSGDVGDVLRITLDSFERTSEGGGVSKYRASMTVKNIGTEEAAPFCGSGGTNLLDSQGRQFEGDSVTGDSTKNCGLDDIQPGLSDGPYVVQFKLPSDAKPSELELWGDYLYEDEEDPVIFDVS